MFRTHPDFTFTFFTLFVDLYAQSRNQENTTKVGIQGSIVLEFKK